VRRNNDQGAAGGPMNKAKGSFIGFPIGNGIYRDMTPAAFNASSRIIAASGGLFTSGTLISIPF